MFGRRNLLLNLWTESDEPLNSYSLSSATHLTSLESHPQLSKISYHACDPPKYKGIYAETLLSPPHPCEPLWVTLVPPSLAGFQPPQWHFPPHTHFPALIHSEQSMNSGKMMERQSNRGLRAAG